MEKYTDEELFSILRDDEKMEKFFQELDGEGLKNFLLYTHSRALKIPFENDSFEKQDMVCGAAFGGPLGLVSPSTEIQEKSIEKIANALKNIQGRENKSLLLHYLVNELHLFSDGNGRTGRCMLDLFLNNKFDFDKSDICMHGNYGYDMAKVSTEELEKKYGVKSVEDAMAYASYMVFRSLLKNEIIDTELNTSDCCFILTSIEGNNTVYMDEKTKEDLSAEQDYKINIALKDASGIPFEAGALALLVMKKRLSQSNNFRPKRLTVGFHVDEKNTFEGWCKEDYLTTREIYDKIKEMCVDMMIDIFEKPENFKINESTTIAECFLKNLNNDDDNLCNQIIQLWKNSSINLEGSRTQQHIVELLQFIEQEHPLQNIEQPYSVQNLGKQTLEQQKNPLGKQILENIEAELANQDVNLIQPEDIDI